MTYRLLAGAEDDIDRILFRSADEWGASAAERYLRLTLAVFAMVGGTPDTPGSRDVGTVPGVRVYPLWLGRPLIVPEQRVREPRHIVVYRIANDGVVEIIGVAHDRMLLARAGCSGKRVPDWNILPFRKILEITNDLT